MPWVIQNGRLTHVRPEVSAEVSPPEVEVVRLTPKQALQREAENLGLDFTDRTTVAELEQMISEAEAEA